MTKEDKILSFFDKQTKGMVGVVHRRDAELRRQNDT